VVGGISGAGKSTLARELARRTGGAYVELDALFHQSGWTQASDEEFRASVAAATAGERWVVDGNYSVVRDLVWARATTFVWPDLARRRTTWRATRRTAVRLLTRRELWNGNRETWRNLLDPGHPIRWSWTEHRGRRERYEAWLADPRAAGVDVVRLRTPREVRRWLRDVLDSQPQRGPS
jgi:adenylate kinase family enzyme